MERDYIDCNAAPLTPYKEWKVVSHRKDGNLRWNPKRARLFLHGNQERNLTIRGHDLMYELRDAEALLNANVLDYLLDNPKLIPDSWKTEEGQQTLCIFFWGTLYKNDNGSILVRYLYFSGGHWTQGNRWLGYNWTINEPCAYYSL